MMMNDDYRYRWSLCAKLSARIVNVLDSHGARRTEQSRRDLRGISGIRVVSGLWYTMKIIVIANFVVFGRRWRLRRAIPC